MQTVTITLPLPSSKLSGHNKGHWRSKTALIKSMRQEAFLAAKRKMVKFDSAGVTYRFLLPDRRRRDVANLIEGCKAYIDGIVDAGMLPDDSWRYLWIDGAKAMPVNQAQEPCAMITFRGTCETR